MNWWYLSDKENTTYPVVILSLNTLSKESIDRIIDKMPFDKNEVAWIQIPPESASKKWKAADFKQYIKEDLAPFLLSIGCTICICQDTATTKYLTSSKTLKNVEGYALDSVYGEFKVFSCPSNRALWMDPEKNGHVLNTAFEAAYSYHNGTYVEPGAGIIKNARYVNSIKEAEEVLNLLQSYNALTVDIETFSLKHYDAGIKTISFALDQHSGVVIHVDPDRGIRNEPVRKLLKQFFENYQGKTIYHNICFDAYILTYQLFMKDLLDTNNLLYGLDVMLKNWDCTKLIAYLATNSCAGNKLSLKHLAQSFAGNYAVDNIADVMKIPLAQLMEYNLVDSLSTWFVYNKYNPIMVQDNQEEFYNRIFKPAVKDIIQMQLTGLPVDMEEVLKLEKELDQAFNDATASLLKSPHVINLIAMRNQIWVDKKNATYKVKRVTLSDAKETFNPNSDQQIAMLLFDVCKLPVLSTTQSGAPSTDGDTLKALRNHTQDPSIITLLDLLKDVADISTMRSTFIPAFKNAQLAPDGWHYLFGNLNLGGTKSGRLSSSDPNLQNLPASSRFSKALKRCVKAAKGWILVGLDFSSLEDMISALTTKDPNKLKVYLDGYDGHCLRAYSYWSEQMPDIDPNSVASINSIDDKYHSHRTRSKGPTFALTYQGTYLTLMRNLGFSENEAKSIEANYHELYKVSDAWVQDKLDQAAKDGYVTVAFGLRLRTPLLKQVVRGTRRTPRAAEAEGRTAGNALGQSWGLLNNRAASEFMSKVRTGKHRLDIRPCLHIHDAQYYIIKDDIEVVHYTNDNLVKAVKWQDDPLIYHDKVKVGGKLSIFYPSWEHEIHIPNGATESEIISSVNKAMNVFYNKGSV